MKQLAYNLGLAALIFLAPIKAMLITVMVLTMADLVLGILAARKQKIAISSAALKRTPIKIFIYEVATITAFVVMKYLTGPEIPLVHLVTTLIGLTELKSILENLDVIYGSPFFTVLTDKIQSLVSALGPDKPKE